MEHYSFMKKSLIILLAGILLEGCFSMRYDFKGGVTIDPKITSFSVQYFDNKATLVEPSFSQVFTEELKTYIQSNTNLRLITGRGDIDFSGFITSYEITPQAISSGETAAKSRFSISVKVNYQKSVNPDDNFERAFTQFREFDNAVSFNDVEDVLSEEIRRDIVEQIFIAAFVNW